MTITEKMWKDIWTHLQEPKADLVVPAPKLSTPPGNQEAGALAKIHTLATDLSVNTADW